MHTAYLILGSNLGDRQMYLNKAIDLIQLKAGVVTKLSSIYETTAWGVKEQPNYLNKVIEIKTSLQPLDLLHTILNIEKELGRMRNIKWESRTIDIDILFIDDMIINTYELSIPHPHISERKFVLQPLNEIAHESIHPVLKKSITELLLACEDTLQVKKWN